MRLSSAPTTPKLNIEFVHASELQAAARRVPAELNIAATGNTLKPPLRRLAVLPAQAAAELKCGALTEPRTTT